MGRHLEITVRLGNVAANEKTIVTSEKGVFKSFSGRLRKFEHALKAKFWDAKKVTFGLAYVAAGLVTRDPDQRELDIVRSRNGAQKLVLISAGLQEDLYPPLIG